MRTLLSLFAQRLSLANYSVGTTLYFETTSEDESQAKILHLAIVDADSRFPWFDVNGFGDEVRSIGWLSTGEIVRADWRHKMPAWSFVLQTQKQWMRKGQLLAYENYVQKIVSELSKQDLPGIEEIWATIETKKEISAAK